MVLTILDSLLLRPPMSESSVVNSRKKIFDAAASINLCTANLVDPTIMIKSEYDWDSNILYIS